MQIDSMISNMRNRSIMKDKQKTNLKLYDEMEDEEILENFAQECEEELQTQSYSQTQPQPKVQLQEEEVFEWGEDEDDFEEELEEDDEDEEEAEEESLNFNPLLEEDEDDFEEFTEGDLNFDLEFEQESEELDLNDLFNTFSRYMDGLKGEVEANLTSRSPQSVYEERGIDSNQKSGIFMIDMYRMNLPEELDEKIKHKSVIDILNAFEISQEKLEADANERKAALENYMLSLKRKSGESISAYRENIRKLEEFIEEINQMISFIEEFYKAQFKIMKAEQSRIESALKFMKGQDFLKNKIQKKTRTKRSMKKQGEGK